MLNSKRSTLNYNSGGYSAEVPPLPIPNRVVKLSIADGTALHRGRVGSRHFEALDIVRYRVLFKMSVPFHAADAVPREPMCTACIVR